MSLREAAQAALEALHIGASAAESIAEQYHEAMKGYRQARHDALDADVRTIRTAIEGISAALAEANPWKAAVHDALVINWTFSAEHEDNPRKAVADLIAAEVRIALDPLVSSEAQALIDRGRAESAGADPVSEDPMIEAAWKRFTAELENPSPLTDEEILEIWSPSLDGSVQRPILGKNKIVAFARAVIAAARGKP